MITILNPPLMEANPIVIRKTSLNGAPYDSETVSVSGNFARVTITTGADWAFVRLLQHGTDYFAPASGNGIMVRAHLLAR